MPFIPDLSDPGNLYDFTGSSNRIFSVYYNSLINRILLYGEFSLNDPERYAFVQGATLRPSDRLTVSFLIPKLLSRLYKLSWEWSGDQFTGPQ